MWKSICLSKKIMKIGIIVQTRMGSTRLPGKAMMKADETNLMLDYTINQLSNCKNHNQIIIATTNLQRDDVIAQYCENLNVEVFRGDEQNVLDRHYQCAKKFSFSHIVRIPSDKPLIDPQIVDLVIEKFSSNKFDYVANCGFIKKNNEFILDSTYPSGTEVEMFSFEALETAWKNAITSEEREHVTPYIYLHPEKFKIHTINLLKDFSDLRWALDYESDMKLIREIISRIKNRPILMNDIISLLENNPKLKEINRINH